MATGAINRRQFLRGDFRGRHPALRPPWALAAEHAFIETCTRCGACVTSCPQSILVQQRDGYPFVDFRRGKCDFCGACADKCAPGALRPPHDDGTPWNVKAFVTDNCLARRGILCITCLEHCALRAIRRHLITRSTMPPEIDVSACSGCGACYRSCPVDAIVLTRLDTPNSSGQSGATEVHS